MSKLHDKLAAGVRQAKQDQDDTKPSAGKDAGKAEAPRKADSKPAAPRRQGKRGEEREDAQMPEPNLDDPWANLYPKRVWPD
ncbi:histone H1 protein [Ectothiorhodospiraceae bacterium 2226]|nr:histone H1 protein [Ectothiorhodospiraceae bacterium 2226]